MIDGLLRRGETANFIAAPKIGKSWLSYGLGLTIATGGDWLNSFRCCIGRVLLIDNELQRAVIGNRIRTVAGAMAISGKHYFDSLDVLSLRGRLLDLHGIASILDPTGVRWRNKVPSQVAREVHGKGCKSSVLG